jgi:hypothetical protein
MHEPDRSDRAQAFFLAARDFILDRNHGLASLTETERQALDAEQRSALNIIEWIAHSFHNGMPVAREGGVLLHRLDELLTKGAPDGRMYRRAEAVAVVNRYGALWRSPSLRSDAARDSFVSELTLIDRAFFVLRELPAHVSSALEVWTPRKPAGGQRTAAGILAEFLVLHVEAHDDDDGSGPLGFIVDDANDDGAEVKRIADKIAKDAATYATWFGAAKPPHARKRTTRKKPGRRRK